MISLSKGERVSLTMATSSTLTAVAMGLGWDAVKKKGFFGFGGGAGEIDLDASCTLFDANGSPLDVVWFRQLMSRDGTVRHSGDNLTGEGDGDDEVISVDLTRLPANVKTLVFTVNSFRGQNFTEVANAFCRLVDSSTCKELARYDLTGGQNCTGVIMAKVTRDSDGWSMTAIGEAGHGRTFDDMAAQIRKHV
jgi:tellurium resistance protein TerZ